MRPLKRESAHRRRDPPPCGLRRRRAGGTSEGTAGGAAAGAMTLAGGGATAATTGAGVGAADVAGTAAWGGTGAGAAGAAGARALGEGFWAAAWVGSMGVLLSSISCSKSCNCVRTVSRACVRAGIPPLKVTRAWAVRLMSRSSSTDRMSLPCCMRRGGVSRRHRRNEAEYGRSRLARGEFRRNGRKALTVSWSRAVPYTSTCLIT